MLARNPSLTSASTASLSPPYHAISGSTPHIHHHDCAVGECSSTSKKNSNTISTPNDITEVFDPKFKFIYDVPSACVVHLPPARLNITRLVLCRNYRAGEPGSCGMAGSCKFVHADCVPANLEAHPIHVNYIWRSADCCTYPRLSEHDGLRCRLGSDEYCASSSASAPRVSDGCGAEPVFDVAQCDGNGPMERIPASRLLLTAAFEYLLSDANRHPNHTFGRVPLRHCESFYCHRMCKAGEYCPYVHALYIDPSIRVDFKRAPPRKPPTTSANRHRNSNNNNNSNHTHNHKHGGPKPEHNTISISPHPTCHPASLRVSPVSFPLGGQGKSSGCYCGRTGHGVPTTFTTQPHQQLYLSPTPAHGPLTPLVARAYPNGANSNSIIPPNSNGEEVSPSLPCFLPRTVADASFRDPGKPGQAPLNSHDNSISSAYFNSSAPYTNGIISMIGEAASLVSFPSISHSVMPHNSLGDGAGLTATTSASNTAAATMRHVPPATASTSLPPPATGTAAKSAEGNGSVSTPPPSALLGLQGRPRDDDSSSSSGGASSGAAPSATRICIPRRCASTSAVSRSPTRPTSHSHGHGQVTPPHQQSFHREGSSSTSERDSPPTAAHVVASELPRQDSGAHMKSNRANSPPYVRAIHGNGLTVSIRTSHRSPKVLEVSPASPPAALTLQRMHEDNSDSADHKGSLKESNVSHLLTHQVGAAVRATAATAGAAAAVNVWNADGTRQQQQLPQSAPQPSLSDGQLCKPNQNDNTIHHSKSHCNGINPSLSNSLTAATTEKRATAQRYRNDPYSLSSRVVIG